MKAIILAVTLQLILSFQILSQTTSTDFRNNYWSMGYFTGTDVKLKDIDNANTAFGYNGGLELSYNHIKGKLAAFVSLTFASMKGEMSDYYDKYDKYTKIYEFTFGIRYFLYEKYFFQGSAGVYNVGDNYYKKEHLSGSVYHYPGLYKDEITGLGINIGIGRKIQLTNNSDLVMIGKIHNIFPASKHILYLSLSAGLVTGNRIKEKSKSEDESSVSLSVSEGLTSPDVFNSSLYEISPLHGFELALKDGNNYELAFNVLYNIMKRESSNSKFSITDLSMGPRYKINLYKFKPFFGIGCGIYYFSENFFEDGFFPGTNINVGIIYNIVHKLSAVIKGKMNFIFEKRKTEGYYNMDAGLRLDI